MTDKQKDRHKDEHGKNTQGSDVAPDEVSEKKAKPTGQPHGSQVTEVNPPSVQPGNRDREQV